MSNQQQRFNDQDAFGILAKAAEVIKADLDQQLESGEFNQRTVTNALTMAKYFNIAPDQTENSVINALNSAFDDLQQARGQSFDEFIEE